MIKSKFRKYPKEGTFIEIPLANGKKGFGRVLASPLMAFYSVCSHIPLSLEEIGSQSVEFRIWVMKDALTTGRWAAIGHVPLEPELQESPWFFKQDIISKALTIYRNRIEKPATLEQCRGLERAAVWSAEHVESRLEDHFAGRPNTFVDRLKVKP